MRRGTILVLGLLMATTAMPPAADARPLVLKMIQQLTHPLRAITGAGRHTGRRAHHRRAATSRPKAPAAAAAAAAAATAGVAGVAATANAKSTANAKATDSTVAEAPSQPIPEPNTTGAAPTQSAAVPADTAVPLSLPEPPQRSAALTASGDETQARASESSGSARVQYHLGKVGPLAWPTAYEDVIGFTLWPKEYGDRLRTHGIGDVLGSAFSPAAALAMRAEPGRTKQARADDNAPAVSTCGSVDLTASDWPIAQIASAIDLTGAQREALERFKTALNDAVSSIKSTCRDKANLLPVERLRSLQNVLWAVHDAAQLIRTPLAAFYDSLDEAQKQKFAAPATAQAGNRTMSRSEMARMCGVPASSDVPMRQIEKGLNPTKEQRASFEVLQKKASEMGQFLLASCLKPIPATPPERLDAAADRLTAVIFAASNVNMALNDFTSRLTDEQKSKLNTMVR